MNVRFFLSVLMVMLLTAACADSNSDSSPEFKLKSSIILRGEGEAQILNMQAAETPSVTSSADWLCISEVRSGAPAIYSVTVSAEKNTTGAERTATVSVEAGPQGGSVTVVQRAASGAVEPGPDDPLGPLPSDMGSTAVQIASRMGMGINIGNTMECPGKEGDWSKPVNITYIRALAAMGFQAVRIPCAWDSHVSDRDANTIDPAWLDRVDEVVEWVLRCGMYAIVNIHWDGGWLENSCKEGWNSDIDHKQRDYWRQIATRLNHFDEHLLLAAMNEPDVDDKAKSKSIDAIMKYQQAMLDEVRRTGGNNASRVLVMQVPNTNIDLGTSGLYSLPADVVADRLMVEAHFYDPYQFNMMEKDESWGKVMWYWGSQNHVDGSDRNCSASMEESAVKAQFDKMKKMYVDKGIPGITGEYAVCADRSDTPGIDKAKWEASVKWWNRVVTEESKKAGMVPFFWETGQDIDRTTGALLRACQIEGVLEGAKASYPF